MGMGATSPCTLVGLVPAMIEAVVAIVLVVGLPSDPGCPRGDPEVFSQSWVLPVTAVEVATVFFCLQQSG